MGTVFHQFTLTNEQYWNLLDRKESVMYTHCRNCIGDMPAGVRPMDWMSLEGIIDLKSGVLTIGCKRCRLPIVSGILHPYLVEHINGCGCEACKKETSNGN